MPLLKKFNPKKLAALAAMAGIPPLLVVNGMLGRAMNPHPGVIDFVFGAIMFTLLEAVVCAILGGVGFLYYQGVKFLCARDGE
jgi:hypothetical protein